MDKSTEYSIQETFRKNGTVKLDLQRKIRTLSFRDELEHQKNSIPTSTFVTFSQLAL